jgi:hypothetical protein
LFAQRNVLEHFEENPFTIGYKKLEIYRFTYLPTFDKPCLFRLDVLSKETGTLTIKRLSGKGGYELGKLELNKTIPLKGKPFKSLLTKLQNPKVWKPYGDHPENAQFHIGFDGETWTLEGLRDGLKNNTKVWSPSGLPYLSKTINHQDYPQLKNLLEDMNPFFQASYSLLRTAESHFTWEKGIHGHPSKLRKTSAIFQSLSYRKAL